MINYGTSREEFISYMLNKQHGYLNKNSMQNHSVDVLVIFSMCMDIDLLMDNILDEEHIFVFMNSQKEDRVLLEKIRLSNFVDDTREKYLCVAEECYGVYEGINRDGILTIQRLLSSEEREQLEKYINMINNSTSLNRLSEMLINRK